MKTPLEPGPRRRSESYKAAERWPTFAVRHPALPLGFRRQRQKGWTERRENCRAGLPAAQLASTPGMLPAPRPGGHPGHVSGVPTGKPSSPCRLTVATLSVSNFMLPDDEINTGAPAGTPETLNSLCLNSESKGKAGKTETK